ncbi:DUF4296 domain-containing protein [Arenibacter certesii]|uniref:DUF4296 domain-containing protein n=1 Tax=Arenibacter certesii TaxID=228955 RepID=A0A918J4N3_9FLAO|nr:DUF4296 domain-containing protein [Arenibacter certesii]GGW47279.1 hypothetical protein GCM10007383_34240 [Arenibacter certesii]
MVKYLLPLILLFLISCNEEVVKKPKNLIQKDKMVSVLYDISLLNAGRSINQNILNEYDIVPMEYIYEKHGIDSLQLVNSDTYYASLPIVYEAIYTEVKERLENEEASINAKKEEAAKKASEKATELKKADSDEAKDGLPKT